MVRRCMIPLACLMLLAVSGGAQQPPTTPPRVGVVVAGTLTSPPQAPPTVEALFDKLEKVRVQKAEIEKQEKELITQIRAAMKKQGERAVKLGIEQAPAPRLPQSDYSPPVLTPPGFTPPGITPTFPVVPR